MKFNDYVTQSILANNQFDIILVDNLRSEKYLPFVKEEYVNIERLIQNNDLENIQIPVNLSIQKGEYLDIMSFTDQIGNFYIVTVYDSDALEQDPQVIEIYLIK